MEEGLCKAWELGVYEKYLPSAQFCCEAKTTLKIRSNKNQYILRKNMFNKKIKHRLKKDFF